MAEFRRNVSNQIQTAPKGTSQDRQKTKSPTDNRKVIDNDQKEYLYLKNIQCIKSPPRDICNIAIATFEKMELSQLSTLEQLNKILRSDGKISFEYLKEFTLKIMTEVWNDNDELKDLLNSNPLLTQLLGLEILVLYDNIMLDPIYMVPKKSSHQRYTKVCLNNSIQPICGQNITDDHWNSYETVISTYTSPNSFTPEMESLLSHATSLGISTQDLNLKNFVTERSLSAFIKTLILAKIKKIGSVNKSKNKSVNILSDLPNPKHNIHHSKSKCSLCKLYQHALRKQVESNKHPVNRRPLIKNYSRSANQKNKVVVKKTQNNNKMKHTELIRHNKKNLKDKSQNLQSRFPKEATICSKCHEPYSGGRLRESGLFRCISDSYIFAGSRNSITHCQCFDEAKRVWEKKCSSLKKPVDISGSEKISDCITLSKLLKRKKRQVEMRNRYAEFCNFNESSSLMKNGNKGFGLLSEERSFFRLGEGALRDAINGYVEAGVNSDNNINNATTITSNSMKKKRVHWFDEISLDSIYGSLTDFSSDLLKSQSYLKIVKIQNNLVLKILSMITILPFEKKLKKVFIKAFSQATFTAIIIWLCFVLYTSTPEIAMKIKHIGHRSTSDLRGDKEQ